MHRLRSLAGPLLALGGATASPAGETPARHALVGFGASGGQQVITSEFTAPRSSFVPALEASFAGGVRVAAGDATGDAKAELVVAGTVSGATHLFLYAGTAIEPLAHAALATSFGADASVACGDVDGDGKVEIIVGGESKIAVFGSTGFVARGEFTPFSPAPAGGLRVAAGDVNGDGRAEIIVAPAAGGGTVRVFDGGTFALQTSFDPFGSGFAGGVNLAAGNLDGDTKADIVCAPATPSPALSATASVAVRYGADTTALVFEPYPTFFNDSVWLTLADLTGDGLAEIVTVARFCTPGSDAVQMRVFDGLTGRLRGTRHVFSRGGPAAALCLAAGDLTDDAKPEIVAADTTRPWLEVRTARITQEAISAYDASFAGGVRVAAGDVTGDGFADTVVAPGAGDPPRVRAFDGLSGLPVLDFFATVPTFTGGVHVATGDVNGDGRADVVTGLGSGGSPLVAVFSGVDGSSLGSFLAEDAAFKGGVRVAVGDVDGDGAADIVTGPGPGGPPTVRAFSPAGVLKDSFTAYASNFTGGIFVATGDVNGDGVADILTGTDGGTSAQVTVLDRKHGVTLHSFTAFEGTFRGGVRVAAGDLDGDGRADVIVSSGPGRTPTVRGWSGTTGTLLMEETFDTIPTGAGVFIAGSTPPPPAARLSSIQRNAGTSRITLGFTGAKGRWIDAERSTDGRTWLPLVSRPGTGSPDSWEDPTPASGPGALYRMVSH